MNDARERLARTAVAALLGGAVLGLAGCAADGGSTFGIFATEEKVRNDDRKQTDALLARIKEVDSRVTQVDARVTQVAAQTAEARKIATDGVSKATAVDTRLSRTMADLQKRTLVEAKTLQFGTGKFALEGEQMKTLDEVSNMLAKNPTYTAYIVGQADARGARGDNSLLSWRRTEHVRRYLSEKGDVLHRISFIGMGEDMANGAKDADQRKVTVGIYR